MRRKISVEGKKKEIHLLTCMRYLFLQIKILPLSVPFSLYYLSCFLLLTIVFVVR